MRSNDDYLEAAKKKFIENLLKAKVYDARMEDSKEGIAASKLTASKKIEGEEHFLVTKIKDLNNSAQLQRNLENEYIGSLFEDARQRMAGVNLQTLFTRYQMDITKNSLSLAKSPINESEVRLLVGNPLIRLFTDFNMKFKVRVSV